MTNVEPPIPEVESSAPIHPGDILGRVAFLESYMNTLLANRLAFDAFSWHMIGDALLPRIPVNERIRMVQSIIDEADLRDEYSGLCDEMRHLFGVRNVVAHYISMYASTRRFEGVHERRGEFQRVSFTKEQVHEYLTRIHLAFEQLRAVGESIPTADLDLSGDPGFGEILEAIRLDVLLDVDEGRAEMERLTETLAARIVEELANKAAKAGDDV